MACKDDRCYPGFYSAAFYVPLFCLALHSLNYTGGVLFSAASAPGCSSLRTGVMMTLAVCQTPSKSWYPRKGPLECADPTVSEELNSPHVLWLTSVSLSRTHQAQVPVTAAAMPLLSDSPIIQSMWMQANSPR